MERKKKKKALCKCSRGNEQRKTKLMEENYK